MISILIAFRFPPKQVCTQDEVARVEALFNYWDMLKQKFDLDLVFVDDYSIDFWVQRPYIYKMPGKKVNWNMAAARNYAFRLSKGDKLLFSDIDHIVSGNIEKLNHWPPENSYCKFSRISLINDEMKTLKPHSNTFLMHRADFCDYDEDFCGNYGYEDSEFFFRLNQKSKLEWIPEELAITYVLKTPRPTLSRDKSINKILFDQKTTSHLVQ